MKPIRYSATRSGGVFVKRTQQLTADDITQLKRPPVELEVGVDEYHNQLSKQERTDVKKRLPYFVGGVLSGSRHDNNVVERTLLTLDIERKLKQESSPPPPGKVVARMRQQGLSGWVYTSIGHRTEEPRYRVVLPLDQGLERGEGLQGATQAAAAALGIVDWCTAESWVLSQPMFLPAKLKGAPFQQWVVQGRPWRRTDTAGSSGTAGSADWDAAADKVKKHQERTDDPVLDALKHAGLYLREDATKPGAHYFTCPWHDQHTTSNATQTVYFAANFNGYSKWGCKCMGTGPDVDGKPHMTRVTLVNWLREHGHVQTTEELGELDEYTAFDKKTSLGGLLRKPPPEQEWALRDWAPVGAVTLLAAPGGQGKSLLILHTIMAAAVGVPWCVFKPPEDGLRTLYVSYEDGPRQMFDRVVEIRDELRDRHGLLYDVDQALEDKVLLHRVDDPGTWLFLMRPDRFSAGERTARVEWLVGYLRHRGVGMVVLDPMVYTHQLEENSVADMALYMQTLNYIAREAGVAVVVVHHMSKFGTSGGTLDEIDAHSLRGASSITDNARSAGVIVGMPYKDAANYGVSEEEARRLAVFKHVKSNYGPLLPVVVFERVGRLLRVRDDVRKLDVVGVKMVKEQRAEEHKDKLMEGYARQALVVLAEHTGECSANQVAVGASDGRWSRGRVKRVLAWCEDREYCESTGPGGQGRSSGYRITRLGRQWLKGA